MSDYERRINPKKTDQQLFDTYATFVKLTDQGTEAEASPQGGKKFDQDKPMIALLPPAAVQYEAAVWTFGGKKYGFWNWHKGLSTIRILSGVLRHIYAYLAGENTDPESGLPHLAHARCGLGMVLQLDHEGRTDLDDRLGKNEQV